MKIDEGVEVGDPWDSREIEKELSQIDDRLDRIEQKLDRLAQHPVWLGFDLASGPDTSVEYTPSQLWTWVLLPKKLLSGL